MIPRLRIARRAFLRDSLRLVGALAISPLPSSGLRRDTESPVQFREHLLDVIPGAYHCAVADVNGDGKPDILVISETDHIVVWYENPTWKKHILTTHAPRPIDLAAYDLDHNGKIVLAVNTQFDFGNTHGGGRVMLYRRGADPDAEWTGREVTSIPTAHRLRWADWDGNHRKELVVAPMLGVGAVPPDYVTPVSIVSYAFNKQGDAEAHPVDQSLTLLHGVCVFDFDGDGRDDLLTASAEGLNWFKPVGKGAKRAWKKTHLADGLQREPGKPNQGEGGPGTGCSEIEHGRLRGGRMFLTTIEPWHGNELCVYLRSKGKEGAWERHLIDDTLSVGHALVCTDLDGDGQDEIVAGGKGGSRILHGYRCVNAATGSPVGTEGTKWERFVIDAGDMPAAGAVAADLNGDGRPDLVAVGSGNGKIKWYENLGPKH